MYIHVAFSFHRSRRHERSHSRSRSYSKDSSNSSSSRSRSPSETRTSAKDTTASSSVTMGTVANATASVTGTSDPKQAHIAHLTALCKQLQRKQAIEDEMPPEERKAKEENEDIEVSSLQHLVSFLRSHSQIHPNMRCGTAWYTHYISACTLNHRNIWSLE